MMQHQRRQKCPGEPRGTAQEPTPGAATENGQFDEEPCLAGNREWCFSIGAGIARNPVGGPDQNSGQGKSNR